jgi:pyruvate dehydrogenase E2 component (dihydrolipoamide acetyltransferase)
MPELVMPKMGDAMEEGTILQWLKKEGDRVSAGDSIAEVQTEKASIEIPATDDGVLTQILVQAGQTVAVGTPIGVLNGKETAAGQKQEAKPAPLAPEAPTSRGGPRAADREQAPGAAAPAPPTPDADLSDRQPVAQPEQRPNGQHAYAAEAPTGGRVKASPLARKVAQEHGVDLRTVHGTGPGGRIVEADVTQSLQRRPMATPGTPAVAPVALPSPAAPLLGTERPMSQMRKIIARRLTQSKQTIPHFYLTTEVDMRAAVQLRGQFNGSVDEQLKISINDLVTRACAVALLKYPQLNSRLEEDVIKTPASVNIGVAVSLDEGLVVPVIRDAHAKSISALGVETRALADRARRGQLKPEEYSGGTFTISNLGMYDVSQFQAVINPPEVAILAVGAVRDTPIVENGAVVPGKQMALTISVDHRVVDGQVAAVFLKEVKRLLQAPLSLFG